MTTQPTYQVNLTYLQITDIKGLLLFQIKKDLEHVKSLDPSMSYYEKFLLEEVESFKGIVNELDKHCYSKTDWSKTLWEAK